MIETKSNSNRRLFVLIGFLLCVLTSYICVMKSVDSGEELNAAEKAIELLGGRLTDVRDYAIPGTAVSHRAVLIEKVRPTPLKYPRPFTKIKKSPL